MDWRAVRRSSAWTRPCERQKKRSRSWRIRTVSVQSVAAILVLLAFSGSYITALAAVAWQVHHAAMSWSLLVLLQLTVLICLLSICASETNSLRDSRCFLLFCQAPTSSRRCCCSIHAYIHTHIHTYIQTHTHIHTYIHTYIHTHRHTYIHDVYIYIYVCMYIHTRLPHSPVQSNSRVGPPRKWSWVQFPRVTRSRAPTLEAHFPWGRCPCSPA